MNNILIMQMQRIRNNLDSLTKNRTMRKTLKNIYTESMIILITITPYLVWAVFIGIILYRSYC